jgi:hypothetical protein
MLQRFVSCDHSKTELSYSTLIKSMLFKQFCLGMYEILYIVLEDIILTFWMYKSISYEVM